MLKVKSISIVLAVVLSSWVASCSSPAPSYIQPEETAARQPELASGYIQKSGGVANKFMVTAANPLAVDAGYQMLKAGGSAVDAAIATQMVLGLVEPQSSGLGGGAFMLHYDGKKVLSFDGRETAPASATEDLFRRPDGKPMSFLEGAVGGRSVGAPGVLRMLEMAHKQYGKLPWAALFAPAIRLAENGFPVSARLSFLLDEEQALRKDAAAAALFYDSLGRAWPAGHILKNPELAKALHEIAAGGADVFYRGHIARDIEHAVKNHPGNPGGLTASDIAAYRPKMREPICTDYKLWRVCGMAPPSSGGTAVAQILGILESRDIGRFAPRNGELDVEAVHLFSEAGRLAYADRDRYIGDPDFVPLPGRGVQALLDKNYLASRAALITDKSMGKAKAGMPPQMHAALGKDTSPELPSTSHISIVDGSGNAVAMTTTIEKGFGSDQMVDGFLLNNQLTDFSFDASDADGPIANRVQAGKRPRSSMSPTLVFEKASNKLVLAIGSPGGPYIINYVAKVLVAMMDWGMHVQEAIDLPNFGSRNGPSDLEQGRAPDALVEALKAKGHNVRVIEQTSGLQGIMLMNVHGQELWFGGADPRREGGVKGD